MTEPLPSEQIEQLMAGFVLGDLSTEETEELERLLAQEPQLAAEVNRLQEVIELMPYALPEVEPPTHLRSAILDAAATPVNREPFPLSHFPWSRIAAGVAALVALALGFDNYRLRQSLQAVQTKPRQFDDLTFSLQRTKTAAPASATVVVNPDDLEATMTIENLPPLPPGKVYVLWTVLKEDAPFTTDEKGAVLTEVFQVDAQGKVTQTFTVPEVYRSKELVSKVAVTVEDETSPQKHKGKPILITDL